MNKQITDEKTGINYTLVGDYYLPDLTLPEEETNITLGRHGRMVQAHLKNHKHGTYSHLVISGKLMQHCKETEDTIKNQLEVIVKQMANQQGVTETLKANDQMKWVSCMNNIRNCAEEIVFKELIYV